MPVRREGLAQTSFLRKLLAYQVTWRRALHKTHLGIPKGPDRDEERESSRESYGVMPVALR